MTDELELKEHADTTHNDAMLGGMGIAGGFKFVDIMPLISKQISKGDLATIPNPSTVPLSII